MEHNEQNQPDLPPQVLNFINASARREHIARETKKIADSNSDELEQEVLMGLWQQLGDHTETYYSAMKATAAFIEVHDKAMPIIRHLPDAVGILILDSLATVFARQAECLRATTEKRDEIMRENPLPGDDA